MVDDLRVHKLSDFSLIFFELAGKVLIAPDDKVFPCVCIVRALTRWSKGKLSILFCFFEHVPGLYTDDRDSQFVIDVSAFESAIRSLDL